MDNNERLTVLITVLTELHSIRNVPLGVRVWFNVLIYRSLQFS